MQRVQSDEQRLHAWRAEAECRLAVREAAARQQAEQASAAIKAAEAAREDERRQLAGRLAEVTAREVEVLRAKAAADAEVACVVALQRQLATALEEQGALRQQLASLQAAHQAEVAVLHLEKERLAAAASAAAASAAAESAAAASETAGRTQQGLSLADSARLQQAVRRLMQRVEQLHGEVEAGRQREHVWRSSAAEAQTLVGKVGLMPADCRARLRAAIRAGTAAVLQPHLQHRPPGRLQRSPLSGLRHTLQSLKAHDRALQHAEELRLALGTAAREVADLQQQAALAAAGAEGPLAAALLAACRDAKLWLEGAKARVGAARLAEEGLRRDATKLQQRAAARQAQAAGQLQHVIGKLMMGGRHLAATAAADVAGGDSTSSEESPRGQATSSESGAAWPGAGHRAGPLFGSALLRPAPQQQWDPHCDWELRPPPVPQARVAQHLAAPLGATPPPDSSPSRPLQQPAQVPPQQAAATLPSQGHATKPPSRTASDILAAYRARQQPRSASGSSGAVLGQGGPSRGASCSLSRESSTNEEAGSDGQQASIAPQGEAGALAASASSAGHSTAAAAATAAAAVIDKAAGTAAMEAASGDSFYVSDLTTSEDSSRF